jgi:signal transduction histidine kinase
MFTSERFQSIWGVSNTTERSEYASVIHTDDLLKRENAHKEALKTGHLDYECRLLKNKDLRWVKVRGIVLFDKKGDPYRLLGVIQDITEQKLFAEQLTKLVKERTAELENKNQELERSNSYLEEFAHAASHDLKEPIRKIQYFTERLKNQLSNHFNEDVRYTFDRIENANQRMKALIDDLLIYSHVSQKPLEKETVDINIKLIKVLEDLELDIQEKGAIIKTDKLPVVQGYKRQLQQLLQNLISNALKYCKPSVAPEIEITSQIVSGVDLNPVSTNVAENKYHLIEVKDNGIGFAQSDAEKIFQMFHRLHGKNEYQGTGVGLSIARKVVENHNGYIKADSAPGKGATFKIYLPV